MSLGLLIENSTVPQKKLRSEKMDPMFTVIFDPREVIVSKGKESL